MVYKGRVTKLPENMETSHHSSCELSYSHVLRFLNWLVWHNSIPLSKPAYATQGCRGAETHPSVIVRSLGQVVSSVLTINVIICGTLKHESFILDNKYQIRHTEVLTGT